jgi:LacI family transcriptional regulator
MAPERRRRGHSAITLADVAARARVSPATATRALNGHPRVRPETRARVLAAEAALGYVPHLGARALATRSSKTIGLLVPSSGDGFWGSVADGLGERAAAAGFSTLLAASHSEPDRERAMIELFLGKRVDGIVIGSAAGTSWVLRASIAPPMVLVNWDAALGQDLTVAAIHDPVADVLAAIRERTLTKPVAHVCTDDAAGTEQATRHLLALGHQRIAFAGLRPVRPALLRLLGVRAALAEARLAPALVVQTPASLEGGQQAGREIVEARPRPTAVVAFDDMVAVGIMRAAHAAHLRVPEDLSIVGFDDVAVAAFVEPPLTTIAQDTAALGRLAVDVILAGHGGFADDIPTVVPGRLVVRESTGRCPGTGREPA